MHTSDNIAFPLPGPVLRALTRLDENGFEAYCVGGCVRDYIMGITPHDFDITTDALPEQVIECFTDCRVIETGLKHGTVTVMQDGEPLEITTFRTDGTYSDGRHPDSVFFTRSLEEDLARRDFTVNAMAYSPTRGLVDPFGGKKHIEQKIICCVGEPDRRFGEDALRILRSLRFSSVLGFEIAADTAKSAIEKAPTLNKISGERIYSELVKLLCGDGAERVLCDFREIFAVIIPPLSDCFGFDQRTKYHKYDVYTHIVKTVALCEKLPVVRLAALFHDISKPACFTLDENGVGHAHGHQERSAEQARELLHALHADNNTISTVYNLILRHDTRVTPERKWVKHLISETSYEFVRLLFMLKRGDILAHADEYAVTDSLDAVLEIVDELERQNTCLSVKALAIGGRDLIEIGITDGRRIGQTLNRLLAQVIDEQLPNTRTALIDAAHKYSEFAE